MSRLHELRKRLALHYLSELEKSETSYRKGEDVLARFGSPSHGDWDQIKLVQQWASQNRETDKTALEICSDYPDRAPNLQSALLDQDERIKWLQTAREAARLLGRIETEIAHLGNMAMTCRNAGRHDEAISLFEELHDMIRGRDDIEEANVLCMLAACRRGTHNGPTANETRRVFADRPTPKRVKTL